MGENDTHQLREMASRLGSMLNAEGVNEREAWLNLRTKLAEFATRVSIADPKITKALTSNAKEAIGSLDLCHREAEALLVQMMGAFGRIVTENASPVKDLIVLIADELSMSPLCVSEPVPMVEVSTNKKEFKFNEDNVEYMVSDWLSSPSTPYGVVSIVGPQSSGKSYLLNQLFGADFPVMKKKIVGWKQTTEGILMSRSIGPSLLILDVEGFDGKEREQDTKFENQAALFALTVSDLMIINISEHDIGRVNGGGQPLFETIFQERTKLPAGLTKILVVLRRCDEETTSEVLDYVIEDMKKLWTRVHGKIEEGAVKFDDYIEVEVFALPEKAMPDFQTKVTQLRKHISKSNLDHNNGDKVPASSFTCSSKELWDKIKQNKRLDLPSIKVAFTKMYCQQIVKDTLISSVTHKELLQAKKSPREFKTLSDALLHSTIAKYNKETVMYDEALRKEERDDLIERIKKIHSECSHTLMQVMRKNMFERFESEVPIKMKQMEESGDENYDVEIVDTWKVQFITLCEDLKEFGVEYFDNVWEELKKDMYSHINYRILKLKEERAKNDLAAAATEKERMEIRKIIDSTAEEKKALAAEMKLMREKQELEHERATEAVERAHQMIIQLHLQEKERLEAKIAKMKAKQRNQPAPKKGWCSIM